MGLRIAFAASEISPFAKAGGLADVMSALPRYLHESGHDVRVFAPCYGNLDTGGSELLPVEFVQDVQISMGTWPLSFSLFTAPLPGSLLWIHFVDCPQLFHRPTFYTEDWDEHVRWGFFSRAVIESCQRMGWSPQVFHCHDWHTALVPLYLKTVYRWDRLLQPTRSLLTIHNLGYQGIFGSSVLGDLELADRTALFPADDLRTGRVSFLGTGVLNADLLSTVSPTYAAEIQTPEYGWGLDPLLGARRESLVGILNGVDYDEWSPERDPFLPHAYDRTRMAGKAKNRKELLARIGLAAGGQAPVLGMVSRLVQQKGIDLAFETFPPLLAAEDIRLVVLGSGETRYQDFFQWLQETFPHKVRFFSGFHNDLAHLIQAGSDIFLMPSRYEPCGLSQIYSLRYGTPPVVRRTGGLADTVQQYDPASGDGTGFLFDHFNAHGFRWAIDQALMAFRERKGWSRLVRRGMAQDFSWETQGPLYEDVYRRLTA